MPRIAVLMVWLAAGAALAFAGEKSKADKPEKNPMPARLLATGSGKDEQITISARALLGRDTIKDELGYDIGAGYIVVEVTVTPAPGEKVSLDLDDFLVRSDKDGQHSRPLTPSQVAGSTVLVVKSVGGTQGRGMSEQRRVPIGGYPGGGYPGGVGSIPTNESPNSGTATADTSSAAASIEERGGGKPNPLLDALKAKVLKDGEIDAPVKGLLYFQIDGRLKPKQLELVYRKAPPRVSVRFVDPNAK